MVTTNQKYMVDTKERVKNPNTTKNNYENTMEDSGEKKKKQKTIKPVTKHLTKVQYLSIITLSVNGWNSPIRRQSGWLD